MRRWRVALAVIAVATACGGSTKPGAAGSSASNPPVTSSEAPSAPSASSVDAAEAQKLQLAIADELRTGVERADSAGGQTRVAVWVGGTAAPTSAGDDLGAGRMWSLSKPVMAVAALLAAEDVGGPSAELMSAMTDAITASDNCGQRRVTLGLQQLRHGVDGARTAFSEVLAQAGITASTVPGLGDITDDEGCRAYLTEHGTGLSDPFGPALLFGITEWTADDASRFGHALATGTYGSAGDKVLQLMRLEKTHPANFHPGDFTASLEGPPSSGDFPASWSPAYKGGWGGHNLQPSNFRASEIVILTVGDTSVVIAAVFRPAVQPGSDDPGVTVAPDALSELFHSLRQAIDAVEPSR